MQKHKKLSARLLAMALTVAMVGTMLPATVFAAEGDVPLGTSGLESSQVLDSGKTPAISPEATAFINAVADLDKTAIKKSAQDLADAQKAGRADELAALEEALAAAYAQVDTADALYGSVTGADKDLDAVKDAKKDLAKLQSELLAIMSAQAAPAAGTPSATFESKTINGTVGTALSGQTTTVTVTGATFDNGVLGSGTNCASNMALLPSWVTRVIATSTSADPTTITLAFAGTPTEASTAGLHLSMPKEWFNPQLSADLAVTANTDAKFNITAAAHPAITTLVNLRASNGTDGVADTQCNHGGTPCWSWVQSSKTLTLNSVTGNVTEAAKSCFYLPAGATVKLDAGSTNTLTSPAPALMGTGALTFQGTGTLTVTNNGAALSCQNATFNSGTYSFTTTKTGTNAIAAPVVTINGGTVSAKAESGSTPFVKEPTGTGITLTSDKGWNNTEGATATYTATSTPPTLDNITVGGGTPTSGYEAATPDSLINAFKNINGNGTITLGEDLTSDNTIEVKLTTPKNVTLNLNGKLLKLDLNDERDGSAILFLDGVKLTVRDSGTGGQIRLLNSASANSYPALGLTETSRLILESGKIELKTNSGPAALVCGASDDAISFTGMNTDWVTINGGTLDVSATDTMAAGVAIHGGNMTINGGTVNATGKSNGIFMETIEADGLGGKLTFNGGTSTLMATGGVTVGEDISTAVFVAAIELGNGVAAKYKSAGSTAYNTPAYLLNRSGIGSFLDQDPSNVAAVYLTDVQISGGSTPTPDPDPTPGGGGGSSGGGSSSGGSSSSTPPPSGGAANGVTTPGKSVIDNPVGNQGSTSVLTEAVKNAIAAGTTNATVYTNFANYTALTKDGLKAVNDAAAAAVKGKNVQLNTKIQLDNKVGNAVVSRITVDPAKLATVMPDKLGLGVWFNQKQDNQVTSVRNKFEKAFDNNMVIVTFEQKDPLKVNMEFAAKPDMTGLNTKSLYFYSYNPTTNIYNRVWSPSYWVDTKGYTHFTAPFGGSVVITDKPLTKK